MRFGPPGEVINEHFSEELGTASFLVAGDWYGAGRRRLRQPVRSIGGTAGEYRHDAWPLKFRRRGFPCRRAQVIRIRNNSTKIYMGAKVMQIANTKLDTLDRFWFFWV